MCLRQLHEEHFVSLVDLRSHGPSRFGMNKWHEYGRSHLQSFASDTEEYASS
jgi:hypothetical protein